MTADTNMVERVARAVTDELLRQRISPSFGRNLEGVNPPLDVPAMARAAIAAMREPTPDMIMAGGDHKAWGRKHFGVEDYAPSGNIYTAMIDAALAEEMASHEDQGTAHDPDAAGYEKQGRSSARVLHMEFDTPQGGRVVGIITGSGDHSAEDVALVAENLRVAARGALPAARNGST